MKELDVSYKELENSLNSQRIRYILEREYEKEMKNLFQDFYVEN